MRFDEIGVIHIVRHELQGNWSGRSFFFFHVNEKRQRSVPAIIGKIGANGATNSVLCLLLLGR